MSWSFHFTIIILHTHQCDELQLLEFVGYNYYTVVYIYKKKERIAVNYFSVKKLVQQQSNLYTFKKYEVLTGPLMVKQITFSPEAEKHGKIHSYLINKTLANLFNKTYTLNRTMTYEV